MGAKAKYCEDIAGGMPVQMATGNWVVLLFHWPMVNDIRSEIVQVLIKHVSVALQSVQAHVWVGYLCLWLIVLLASNLKLYVACTVCESNA